MERLAFRDPNPATATSTVNRLAENFQSEIGASGHVIAGATEPELVPIPITRGPAAAGASRVLLLSLLSSIFQLG